MNLQRIREAFARLLDDVSSTTLNEVVLWLAVLAGTFVIVRLVRRWIDATIQDVNRRHALRKVVGYVGFLLVAAMAVALLIGQVREVATVVGLIGAGLVIALQDLGKSAIGWLYLSSHGGFGPGARIEVNGVTGDVIDVGVLKTTVVEVGNLVYGRQSSGRIVTIPNDKLLRDNLFLTPSYASIAWQEIQFLLTYESDWRKGAEILDMLGRREFAHVDADTLDALKELERRYAFKYGARTPIVYVRAAESGIQLTLRYLSHIRRRRGTQDRITRGMLEAVEREPDLDFAYPTLRLYGDAGDVSRDGGAPAEPIARRGADPGAEAGSGG